MVLKIKNCSKKFTIKNEDILILNNINLEIKESEFITIVGHSGCGKSTLLKLIVGLDQDYEGEITYKNKKVTKPNDKITMVFQDNRLLPWLNIEQNILFGLDKTPIEEKRKIVNEYLEIVNLTKFANAYPRQLSGGMAQRASIARSLVTNPDVLLLDEPFGALDALTKINMQNKLLDIWQKNKTTMILVTHDIEEAVYLGNKVLIMSDRPGKIIENIEIKLSYPRDRNSSDFLHYKKNIYKHFFSLANPNQDFEI